jgi:4-amino-4-deoxy-L-arabinose transferase-like glycosyltransferase
MNKRNIKLFLRDATRSKNMILFLILISIAGNVYFLDLIEGISWNEAVNLGLSHSITKLEYSLSSSGPLETYKPPLFSLILLPVYQNIVFSRVLVIILGIAAIYSTYVLAKELFFRKETGVWAAVLISTNYLFIFFTSRVLSETLMIILVNLSFIFFFRWRDSKSVKNLVLCSLFASAAFMAHYLSITILGIYLALMTHYLFRRRIRPVQLFTFFAIAVIVLSPWLFIGYKYYGNPLGSLVHETGTFVTESGDTGFQERIYNLLVSPGILNICYAGLFFVYMNKKAIFRRTFPVMLAFMAVFLCSVVIPYRLQYVMFILPLCAPFGGFAVDRFLELAKTKPRRRLVILVLVTGMIFSFTAGFTMIREDVRSYSDITKASMNLKNLTGERDAVLTMEYPYVCYLSERQAVPLPDYPEDIVLFMDGKGIDYVLVYYPDERNPGYVKDYFTNTTYFDKIVGYPESGMEEVAVIYRIRKYF